MPEVMRLFYVQHFLVADAAFDVTRLKQQWLEPSLSDLPST